MPKKRDPNAPKNPVPKQLKPFQKGTSGNPEGARAHNPALKALKNLTLETYREVIQLVLEGNLKQLKAMIEDPETPAIQVGVATSFMKAIKNGDYNVIEQIASRIVGKIPDVVHINSNNISKTTTDLNVGSVVNKEVLKQALKELEDEV